MTETTHDTFCTCEACRCEPPSGTRDSGLSVVELALLRIAENVAKHIVQRSGWEPVDTCFEVDLRESVREIEQLIEQRIAAQQPAALAWTREPPTRPGLYWIWNKEAGRDRISLFPCDLECDWVRDRVWHWYGPLPEPPGDPTQ